MLTVSNDAAGVARLLDAGGLACPGCRGRLARWGFARQRTVFGPGRCSWTARPRRSRCTGCKVTHVLEPSSHRVSNAARQPPSGRLQRSSSC